MSFLASIIHAADKPAASSGNFFSDNLLTFGLLGLLVVMVIFMVRNSRKRKRDAEELQNKFVPGAEVMTQHGIYGTLISIDDEKNEAIVETTPGTRLRVHRQTIARVIDPQEIDPSEDVVADEPVAAAVDGEPEYGERLPETETEPETAAADADAPAADAAPAKKPATRASSARSTTTRASGTGGAASKPRTPRAKPSADE